MCTGQRLVSSLGSRLFLSSNPRAGSAAGSRNRERHIWFGGVGGFCPVLADPAQSFHRFSQNSGSPKHNETVGVGVFFFFYPSTRSDPPRPSGCLFCQRAWRVRDEPCSTNPKAGSVGTDQGEVEVPCRSSPSPPSPLPLLSADISPSSPTRGSS